MTSIEVKEAFKNLDLDDKRNEISNEILMIENILQKIENNCNISSDFYVKDYESNSDMTEEEYLSFIYDDIFEIRKQLILISIDIENDKNN